MTVRTWIAGGVAAGVLAVAGCGGSSSAPSGPKPGPTSVRGPTTDDGASDVAANLTKLSSEDKKLAEAQQTCPQAGEPLGSMGVPVKLTLKGETVFLCCASCVKAAEKDPDATLKKVAELKVKGK